MKSPKNISSQIESLSKGDFKNKIAELDFNRSLRCGAPEAILCETKSIEQISEIAQEIVKNETHALFTRCDEESFEEIQKIIPKAQYYRDAKCAIWGQAASQKKDTISILCAGTSDLKVAEEAQCTLKWLGYTADTYSDVGVAGLHRLLGKIEQIQKSQAIIVFAGMEAALASVIAGLVSCPIIAVPTSVGYGSSFEGLAALLGMLNSCSPGIGVVNIDNGFGGAMLAHRIIQSSAK